MKRANKTKYITPVCEVVECRPEGVLAWSGPNTTMNIIFLTEDTYGASADW